MEIEFTAEAPPTRVRIEERRTPDGTSKWWSECDAQALDAIAGESAEEATARVLARINAPFGAQGVTPTVGQTFAYDRVFTVEDVELFTRLTGDVGRHHVTPDAEGRVMVHGLLTATLPTRFGGEINFLAREMSFEFIRPVFTGDVITTSVVCVEAHDEDRLVRLAFDVVCKNQHGKEVLKGKTNGVIRK